jgi:hypothetical protein
MLSLLQLAGSLGHWRVHPRCDVCDRPSHSTGNVRGGTECAFFAGLHGNGLDRS